MRKKSLINNSYVIDWRPNTTAVLRAIKELLYHNDHAIKDKTKTKEFLIRYEYYLEAAEKNLTNYEKYYKYINKSRTPFIPMTTTYISNELEQNELAMYHMYFYRIHFQIIDPKKYSILDMNTTPYKKSATIYKKLNAFYWRYQTIIDITQKMFWQQYQTNSSAVNDLEEEDPTLIEIKHIDSLYKPNERP